MVRVNRMASVNKVTRKAMSKVSKLGIRSGAATSETSGSEELHNR